MYKDAHLEDSPHDEIGVVEAEVPTLTPDEILPAIRFVHYDDDVAQQVVSKYADGASMRAICAELHIDFKTPFLWERQNEGFHQAMQLARPIRAENLMELNEQEAEDLVENPRLDSQFGHNHISARKHLSAVRERQAKRLSPAFSERTVHEYRGQGGGLVEIDMSQLSIDELQQLFLLSKRVRMSASVPGEE